MPFYATLLWKLKTTVSWPQKRHSINDDPVKTATFIIQQHGHDSQSVSQSLSQSAISQQSVSRSAVNQIDKTVYLKSHRSPWAELRNYLHANNFIHNDKTSRQPNRNFRKNHKLHLPNIYKQKHPHHHHFIDTNKNKRKKRRDEEFLSAWQSHLNGHT